MTATRSIIKPLFFVLIVWSATQTAYSQSFGNGYYRLTTKWLGDERSLDVVNDGTNSKVQLSATSNADGQAWKITAAGDGYYRLTTKWLGAERSLDVTAESVRLAVSANVTGQLWKITPLGNGYYRFTTKWLGDDRSLAVVNDSARDKLSMFDTQEVTGQYWKISAIDRGPIETKIRPLNEFEPRKMSGFTVNVHPDLVDEPLTNDALEIISKKIVAMVGVLKPSQVSRLQKVPIWVQYKLVKDGAIWYHTDKAWLAENGYPAEIIKSIEVSNVSRFIEGSEEQPFDILHEFAHAYQDLYLSEMQEEIRKSYKAAIASGKYDKVKHVNGSDVKHYALTSETEYFAELTEAYLGKNDYFPFNRKELEKFDPRGFELVRKAWE